MAKPKMQIFRAAEAPLLSDENAGHEMSYAPMSQSAQDGFARLIAAGINDGTVVKMLFAAPGFSLAYVWFKANFPLARHSHNADCLYYIIAGGLKLGTEELGPGDGFLLPSGTPYTYAVGEEGVELLEFRHTGHFDFRAHGGTAAFWNKAEAVIAANRDAWRTTPAPRPAA
jgi:hypothetical protein